MWNPGLSLEHWLNARKTGLLIILGFLVTILYLAFLPNVQVGVSDDDAHYIVAAQSLANGEGYVLINFPEPVKGQIYWPPGYPLFLVPFVHLWPINYIILQMTSIILTISWLFIGLVWFRKGFGDWIALGAILLTAVNPRIIGIATQVRSEALFLLLVFGSFVTLHKWLQSRSIWSGWLFLTALCAVYATAVRSVGVVLILALIATVLFLRKWREGIGLTILVGLFYLPLAFFMVQQGGTFLAPTQANQSQIIWTKDVVELARHIIDNLSVYLTDYLPMVLTSLIGPQVTALAEQSTVVAFFVFTIKAAILFLIGIGALAIGGKCLNTQKLQSFYQIIGFEPGSNDRIFYCLSFIFPLLYFALILTFKDANPRGHDAQVRYLIPLVPFAFLFLIVGWLTCQNYLRSIFSSKRLARYELLLPAILIGLFLISSIGRNTINLIRPNQGNIPDISMGATWINQHTPLDAIVACDDPVPRYLYLQRKTVRYPRTDSTAEILTSFEVQPNYLLIAPRLRVGNAGKLDLDQEELISVLMHSLDYHLVYGDAINNIFIFEFEGSIDVDTSANSNHFHQNNLDTDS